MLHNGFFFQNQHITQHMWRKEFRKEQAQSKKKKNTLFPKYKFNRVYTTRLLLREAEEEFIVAGMHINISICKMGFNVFHNIISVLFIFFFFFFAISQRRQRNRRVLSFRSIEIKMKCIVIRVFLTINILCFYFHFFAQYSSWYCTEITSYAE